MALRKTAVCAVLSLALPLCVAAQQPSCPTPEQPNCPNPQSPRQLSVTDSSFYDRTSMSSIVRILPSPMTIEYLARPGAVPQQLRVCGQHYHRGVENRQGCPGEGAFVEVHTVYASRVHPFADCDTRSLDCCEAGPFVVLAFSAKNGVGMEPNPNLPFIQPRIATAMAEWLGSSTNQDRYPGECQAAAQWSFQLGCNFTVRPAELTTLGEAKEPRAPQSCNRLSRDLTLAGRLPPG
ncbi:MAG TPA: hypothetical protein VLX28_14785 [Thermoanaerobaculia bacterium]|nr:hypothetical protein [Thermoanaerobaculia bacterium]